MLQAYLSNSYIDGFALVSDSNYVAQNSGRLVIVAIVIMFLTNSFVRILRALFEYALKKGWTVMVQRILTLCKMVDRRVWGFQHPLRQFASIPTDILTKLEAKNVCFLNFKFFT